MKKALIILLAALAFLPAFSFAPEIAHANDYNGDVPEIISEIKNTISAAADALTSGSVSALEIKEYVLDPIAWTLSQKILQSVTGSVVNFVNGQGSGGSPLYVQNLSQYLGAVGDNQALNFFAEIGTQSNSPFAAAIASSLRTNYLQSTSAAGFWAANSCTLNQSSPNINSYLAGNFSANGGWSAWFALTTQPNNNPYSLYYSAQAELNSRVTTAQTQKTTQLSYSSGFLSFCNTPSGASSVSNSAAKGAPKVGDPCVNNDGTSGTVATPGSVIAATLNKSLGSGVDKLVAADEIDEVIGQLASGLLTEAIGGGGNGGLAGLSDGGNSYISQYQNESTSGSVAGTSVASLVQTAQSNVSAYQTAWQTISAAAEVASSSVQAVIACENKSGGGNDPYGALPALNSEVDPVIAQAATAQTNIVNIDAMIAQVNADSASSAPGASGTLAADSQTLAAMPPTATDVANAQASAQVLDGATSSSATSLIVSGGTTVDQMNLLTTTAGNALNACENPSS